MARDPAALQLRLLQTVVEVAGEKNSTLVMPVPVELLRFFEKMAPGPAAPASEPLGELEDFGDAEVAAAEAAISNVKVPELEESSIPPVPEVEGPVAPEVREVTAPDRCRQGQGVRSVHAKVGVRDGAVARARDQADPGQLGRRRVGAGGGDTRPQLRAAGRVPEKREIMSGAAERLAALGLTLPPVAAPVAAYVPAVRTGTYVYTSGQLPTVDGKLPAVGKVGDEVSAQDAAGMARTCALNALAAAASAAGGLAAIRRIVKVTGFVASAPGFGGQAQVINGASELLIEVFGEDGKHARSAIGVAELPLNAPVEVELIAEVRD